MSQDALKLFDHSVLIVEDDPDIREVLASLVMDLTHNVYEAKNGLEAKKILAEKPVDLILTDIKMPGLDGITLLEDLRKKNHHALAIVITGYGSREEVKRALVAGCHDFIDKPFQHEMVVNRIKVALETISLRKLENQAISLLFRYFDRDVQNVEYAQNSLRIQALSSLLTQFNARIEREAALKSK